MSAKVSSAIRLRAINQRRKQLFGDSSLKVYTTTPEDGETEAGEFETDWKGFRVDPTTGQATRGADSSSWQFQIEAEADWKTSQVFMLSIVALMIGEDRWKITKVEKPIGNSLIWKLKAQQQ